MEWASFMAGILVGFLGFIAFLALVIYLVARGIASQEIRMTREKLKIVEEHTQKEVPR